jgi:hypothetical protein
MHCSRPSACSSGPPLSSTIGAPLSASTGPTGTATRSRASCTWRPSCGHSPGMSFRSAEGSLARRYARRAPRRCCWSGSPRDVLLTALAAALPYLMVVFAAAVAWLLTGRAAARPAAEPDAASSAVQAIDRTGSVGTREWRGLRRIAAALPRSTSKGVFPTAGAGVNGMSRRFEAFRAERVGVTMRQREWQAKL